MKPCTPLIIHGEYGIELGVTVLFCCIYYGMDLCEDICTIFCPEASTYLLFYLDIPDAPFAGIVIIRNREVFQKGEDVVFYFAYPSCELGKIFI